LRDEKSYNLVLIGLILMSITFSIPSLVLANSKTPEYRIKGFILCDGKIVFLSFEGGFYGIITMDGNHYDPINLPAEFKIDGLRVFFAAHITDLGSFHMWGRVIKIIYIFVLGYQNC
jgi:hypothetical protein